MDELRDRYRRFSDDNSTQRRPAAYTSRGRTARVSPSPHLDLRPPDATAPPVTVASAPVLPPALTPQPIIPQRPTALPALPPAPVASAAAAPPLAASPLAAPDAPTLKAGKVTDAKDAIRKKGKKKRSKAKLFIIPVAFLLLFGGAGGAAYMLKFRKSSSEPYNAATIPQAGTEAAVESEEKIPGPTGTIRLVATGEMMAHDSVNQNARKADGTYDYAPFFTDIKPYMEKADIRVCSQGTPSGGAGLGISGHPSFNAPVDYARGIQSAGCNVINTASFHMNDKGQGAIDATLDSWKDSGVLAVAGANRSPEEQQKIQYFTVKQVKFAFLAYTTSSQNTALTPHGINVYSDALFQAHIKEARENAQFVIVGMYWGADGSADITPEQEAIANTLAKADVDVVLGQGSHVVQSPKVLEGTEGHQTLVWFGLGNSLNTQLPAETLVGGIAVMDIDASTRKIVNPKFLPTFMAYEWSPAQKQARTLNARTNLRLYALDRAADPIAKSQLGTTVDAQTARITALMTKFIPVKVIKSSEY